MLGLPIALLPGQSSVTQRKPIVLVGNNTVDLPAGDDVGDVSYSQAQALTVAQQQQALANLGITAGIGTTGYVKLNNGSGTPIYIQWGNGQVPSSGALAITFPISFPNALGAVICGSRGSGGGTMLQTATTSEGRSSFQANMNYTSGGSTAAAGNNSFYWMAIGY